MGNKQSEKFLVIIPCGDIPWINRLKHGFQDDVTDVL
jgi:hypothetical protein